MSLGARGVFCCRCLRGGLRLLYVPRDPGRGGVRRATRGERGRRGHARPGLRIDRNVRRVSFSVLNFLVFSFLSLAAKAVGPPFSEDLWLLALTITRSSSRRGLKKKPLVIPSTSRAPLV